MNRTGRSLYESDRIGGQVGTGLAMLRAAVTCARAPAADNSALEEIVVTGYRKSVEAFRSRRQR